MVDFAATGSGPASLKLVWDRASQSHESAPLSVSRLRLLEAPLARVAPESVFGRHARSLPRTHARDAATVVLSSTDFVLSGRIFAAFRVACPELSSKSSRPSSSASSCSSRSSSASSRSSSASSRPSSASPRCTFTSSPSSSQTDASEESDGGIILKLHVPEPADFGALEETAVEGWVYEHRLPSDIVPEWYGMYAGGRDRGPVRILAAALEDVGEPMSPDEVRDLTPTERGKILAKYAKLHAAGVVHGSPKPKHWLRPRGGGVDDIKIIDFGAARVLEGPDVPSELRRDWCVLPPDEFRECVYHEYRELLSALGL